MGEQTEQAWGQVQKALRASQTSEVALSLQRMDMCMRCLNAQKWAFYAGCCASFTLGLLGGMCAVALAWSHLGG